MCLYEHQPLTLTLCHLVRECLKFLKLKQITNFDMGFRKNTFKGDVKTSIFFRSSELSLKLLTFVKYPHLYLPNCTKSLHCTKQIEKIEATIKN